MLSRWTLLYCAIGVGVLALAIIVGGWLAENRSTPAVGAPRPSPLQEMQFNLITDDGQVVGPDSLIGQPSIVFFGFTFCPDVCPTTLSDISGWLDELGTEAEQLNVVFITVDPERDDVEAINGYLESFHPAILGWTGSPPEIARAAAGFGVVYQRVPLEGGTYTMNHTASVLLYGTDGSFVGTIDYHEQPETAVPKIRRLLQSQTNGGER